jgi:hypothetical protein
VRHGEVGSISFELTPVNATLPTNVTILLDPSSTVIANESNHSLILRDLSTQYENFSVTVPQEAKNGSGTVGFTILVGAESAPWNFTVVVIDSLKQAPGFPPIFPIALAAVLVRRQTRSSILQDR